MLQIRHHPGLDTPRLVTWLRQRVRYDAGGRYSALLKSENAPMPPELAAVAESICGHASFREVALQGYAHGRAITPCHSDRGITGFSFILSLGATRTLRFHRIVSGDDPCRGLADAIHIGCVSGTVVLMDECLHDHWHHQLVEDQDVMDERLSLVFRTTPTRASV